MGQFRKKPVVIEAIQWFKGGDHPAVRPYEGQQGTIKGFVQYGWINTLEGGHIVTPGDWIIKGVQGEFYPCKPDIFAATYEDATLPPEPVGVPDSFREGVEAAARLIDQKADVYAARFGHDDVSGLSFGTGPHAGIKRDTHSGLIELADEIRALLAAAPQPDIGKTISQPEQPAHDFAALIHYPEHWDTAAYPTLDSALAEVLGCVGCSECKAEQPAQSLMPRHRIKEIIRTLMDGEIAADEAVFLLSGQITDWPSTSWTLDEETAGFLAEMILANGEEEPTAITLHVGLIRDDNGDVKHGLLVCEADYPEEGSSLLVESEPYPQQPAQALTDEELDDLAWNVYFPGLDRNDMSNRGVTAVARAAFRAGARAIEARVKGGGS